MTSAPLPTDGINTTYWPYQVAVTDRLIAVATNTGASSARVGPRQGPVQHVEVAGSPVDAAANLSPSLGRQGP